MPKEIMPVGEPSGTPPSGRPGNPQEHDESIPLVTIKSKTASEGNQAEGFTGALADASDLGLNHKGLGRLFRVPEWVISEWVGGISEPRPKIQQHVIATLQKRAESLEKRGIGQQEPPNPTR